MSQKKLQTSANNRKYDGVSNIILYLLGIVQRSIATIHMHTHTQNLVYSTEIQRFLDAMRVLSLFSLFQFFFFGKIENFTLLWIVQSQKHTFFLGK